MRPPGRDGIAGGAPDADAAFLAKHSGKDVLRFITCGSVDDGKSTLIGRLLHDCKQVFEDQLDSLRRDSRRSGTQRGGLDFALLLDGLSAEREQGITIDVAHRFFATSRRTFIVADTPGHEQYTRNMATGASNAEIAVLLIDVRKGVSRQTRRHSLLLSMLGIRRIVLAINKMDLVGWSEAAYRDVMDSYAAFARPLGFVEMSGIPLSALHGDNVVTATAAAPWYDGPTLLRFLEEVPHPAGRIGAAFRMPVEWVNRPDPDFRGYAGMVAAGRIAVGDSVTLYPAGAITTIARIVTFDADLPQAEAGQSVTFVLAGDHDVSRGDLLAAGSPAPLVAEGLRARLFWIAERALETGATYQIKIGAAMAVAVARRIDSRIDPDAAAAEPANALATNEIGDVALSLDRALAFDPYEQCRDTGGLILIDRESGDTVAMGLILAAS